MLIDPISSITVQVWFLVVSHDYGDHFTDPQGDDSVCLCVGSRFGLCTQVQATLDWGDACDEDQLEYEAALESDGFCSVHRHCGSAVCSVLQRTCSVKPYICYRKRKSAYTLVVSKSIKLN